MVTVHDHLGPDLPGVTHHTVDVDGAVLHHVSAGSEGSPILLVHGWPETWWAFRDVIPRLAASHRVIAVDLRGFGDSRALDGRFDVAATVADLHQLVAHLGLGPVHVAAQDLSGPAVVTFAATHPDDVRSLTAVETALPGPGFEALADVAHGGSWHVGFFATPGVAPTYLQVHERTLLDWAYSVMALRPVDADAVDEFARTYGRPGGWDGSAGLYRSALTDHGATRAALEAAPLRVPVLAVDGVNAPSTAQTLRQVTRGDLTAVHLEGVGHLVAQEDPAAYAATLLAFVDGVDGIAGHAPVASAARAD